MKKIKPPHLRPGQNLGIVALSTPAVHLKKEYRTRAYERIQKLFGLNIIEASNLDSVDGHAAGSIRERAKSINDFFKRKDIHGIMSFWGGFNTHQILEYLNYDLIKSNPKVLVGYSDTTTLLSAITAKTGLITFNGPAVITFAKPTLPQETVDCFRALLFQNVKSLQFPVSEHFTDTQWWLEDKMEFTKNEGLRAFRKGTAEGIIVGGNVGTLLLLVGTPYWPSMKGKILFVEDDEAENTKTIDRYFTQLRQMGVFGQISGMVVGRFPGCVGLTAKDSLQMILENALKGYQIPVITEFDMGHTDPLMTIPLGVKVSLDATKKRITVLEKVTS